MTEIIAALQEEIAAARQNISDLETTFPFPYGEKQQAIGYIHGLQTAVKMLKNWANTLPFTAENGDCTFMENGDLR